MRTACGPSRRSEGRRTGAYILILQVRSPLSLDVGKLGSVHLPSGCYCYVGSGMQNLDKRVERHFAPAKKVHWHIDYLTIRGLTVGALMLPSALKQECEINAKVSSTRGCRPIIPGFGSSDCSCLTHLHRLSPVGLRNLTDVGFEYRSNPAIQGGAFER